MIFLFTIVSNLSQAGNNELFVEFSDVSLHEGRQLWIDNCKACHAYGTAGAPIPMDAEDWRERVLKTSQVLYIHALDGFYGPDDTIMPAKGGNPDLTIRQVTLAVDYMVALAKFYIKKQLK